MDEVNFEKRGKLACQPKPWRRLEDHQTCPICQACICDGHSHSHAKIRTIFAAILLCLSLASPAWANPTAPYDFQTFDITIPGHPDLIVFPADLNDKRDILTNIRENDLTQAVVLSTKVNKRGKVKQPPRLFSCSNLPFIDTFGESINRKGDITGSCIVGGREVGFIQFRNGHRILLDFPGADGTAARGISDNGKITGQFYGPLDQPNRGALAYRFHCWTFDPATNQFTQIDFLAPSTFVDCFAINKKQQVLVRFITVTNTNDTIRSGFALYDNGNWSFPFPDSFEHIGGVINFVPDLNNHGQAIIERSNVVDDGLQLYDDGKLFEIPTPVDWLNIRVGGMNNDAEFVGSYSINVCDSCGENGGPAFVTHGFLATPKHGKH